MISQEMHEKLSAYLDGELDAEAREEMERLLEEQPELRAALEQMRRVDDLVRHAAPEAPAGLVRDTLREIDEATPTRVKVRFRGPDEVPRRRSPVQYLAAAVMLCAGMAALYLYQTQSARSPRDAEMLMAREGAGAPAQEPPGEKVYRLEMVEEAPKGAAQETFSAETAQDALGAAVGTDADAAKAESLPPSAPPAPGSGGGASAVPQEAAPLAEAATAEQSAPSKVTRNSSLLSKSSVPEAGEAGRGQTSPTAPSPAPAVAPAAPPTAQDSPSAPAQSPASPKPNPPDGGGIHSGVALGRVVEGKVFLQTPDGWMERGYAGEKVTELSRDDEAFKKLLAEHPAVDKISALGGVVLFRFDTTWYLLTGGEANSKN